VITAKWQIAWPSASSACFSEPSDADFTKRG
jgi:hypothetical protein